MQKIDKVVLKETKYMVIWMLIFSTVLQSVFLVIGKWNYTVLLGNLLSGTAMVLNFLLMGMTVQKAVGKEPKEAKQAMRASGMARTFFLFVVAAIGILLNKVFSVWTVIIPMFFPRLIVAIRPLWDRSLRETPSVPPEDADPTEDELSPKEDSEHEA